jgi:hypothetical protein
MTSGRTLPHLFAVLFLLTFLPVLGLAGCDRDREPTPGSVDARGPQGIEVTNVQLGSRLLSDKRVAEQKDEFRPNDTIYLSVETRGDAAGELEAVWEYESGHEVDRTTHRIAPGATAATTEFHISKPDGWPVGKYEVSLHVDGREVESREFEVERN